MEGSIMEEKIHQKTLENLMSLDESINLYIDECIAIVRASSLPWLKKRFRIFRLNRLRKKYGCYRFSISFFCTILSSFPEHFEEGG